MATVSYLLDSNIFLRLAKHDDPSYALVTTAVDQLIEENADLYYTPQNVIEFWNVFTRPRDKNGFGLTVAEANRETALIESRFLFVPDNERIYLEWRRLVVAQGISGVQVHDARLAAAMRVHSITHILTLNAKDFLRYKDITAVHPAELSAPDGRDL